MLWDGWKRFVWGTGSTTEKMGKSEPEMRLKVIGSSSKDLCGFSAMKTTTDALIEKYIEFQVKVKAWSHPSRDSMLSHS